MFDRIRQSVRVPGLIEASGVIVAAGATLAVVGAALGWGDLPPKPTNPQLWWVLLWITAGAALLFFGWGVLGIAAWGSRGITNILGRLTARLPFEFRSPMVRKVPTLVIPPLDAPLGFLDFEAEATAALKRMTKHLGLISRETESLGKTLDRYTPRFASAVGWSPEAKRALGRETGAKIDEHARRMEDQQVLLRQGIDAMAVNYVERIRYADADGVSQLRPSIVGMQDSTASSRPSIIGLRDATITIRKQNVQQSINQASDRLIDVLGRLVSDFDAVTRFTTEALELVDEKIAAANVEKAQEEAERDPAASNETAG
jgi:hypothetical protein